MGIDILCIHSKNIFYNKADYHLDSTLLMKADLEIRDPICQGKNMTRNCYNYPKIKKLFENILEKCFRKGEQQLEDILKAE